MAKRSPDAATVHELTLAEIERQTGEYVRRRQAAVAERAAIYQASKAGAAEPQPLTEPQKLARERAKQMLNGHAADFLAFPPDRTRSQELQVEIDACDIILHTLSQKEPLARQAASELWMEQHGADYRALCRNIVLTAVRLEALERRARRERQALGFYAPAKLPMAADVGGFSIVAVAWDDGPLSRPIAAALAENIISERDLKDASNV